MEMDDPWGSPWADEIKETPQTLSFTKEQDNVEVGERLKTPTLSSSSALQQQIISPWDNGDTSEDLEDWAEIPKEAVVELDGANDDWVGSFKNKNEKRSENHTPHIVPTAWDDFSISKDDPVAYLAPSFLPNDEENARLPSPDPWASSEKVDNFTKIQDGFTGEDRKEEVVKMLLDENATASALELLPGASECLSTEEKVKDGKAEKDISVGLGDQDSLDNEISEMEISPSSHDFRPASSSSPSEHSHHDEIPSESPRTSLDEEPKRSQVSRKLSPKVQDLVEQFDIMARKDEAIELFHGAAIGERVRNNDDPQKDEEQANEEVGDEDGEGLGEDDDFGDFGDFEEGQSGIDESVTEEAVMEERTPAPAAESKDTELGGKSLIQFQDKDYGPINLTPDLILLEKLYPDLDEEVAAERCFISDAISHDSFNTVDERKMWYRVSRYGPMRKHNTGDDENYVRVNWARSQVRMETLKIVARWIEEDRVSGRVVLGGGSRAGSVFGWNDPKLRPASISDAFASKKSKKTAEAVPIKLVTEIPREWPKGLVRDRSTSKGRSSSKVRRRSSTRSTTTPQESKLQLKSPVTNFGWNADTSVASTTKKPLSRSNSNHKSSGSVSSSVSATQAHSPKQDRRSRSRNSSTNNSIAKIEESIQSTLFPATKLETSLPPSLVKPTLQSVAPSSSIIKSSLVVQLENDDEDWGEMMSSPVTAAPPLLLPLQKSKGLRHKRSQSFGGVTSLVIAEPPSHHNRPSLDSGSHRPMVTFDEVLLSQTQSPQISNTIKTMVTIPILPLTAENQIDPWASSAPAPAIASVPAVASDPWDFSFFESAPVQLPVAPPKPKAKPIPIPVQKALQEVGPTKSISFVHMRAPPVSSPLAPARNTGKSREEMEQDRIVQSVLESLPDLSYMLKR